jgi:hypothetical protein
LRGEVLPREHSLIAIQSFPVPPNREFHPESLG